MANPASTNCLKQGGTVVIERAGDGGQYGVCRFEDNRQCEEWALLRGTCPTGGIKITGYATAAGRYCAIRGGTYTVTAEVRVGSAERGSCRTANGKTCDARAYFDGNCQ